MLDELVARRGATKADAVVEASEEIDDAAKALQDNMEQIVDEINNID